MRCSKVCDTLSKTLGAGAAAVPRADCGMSADATRALEQSRRSAPVNNHVCCRLQSPQKGSTLKSVLSQLWCGKDTTSARCVSSPRYVSILPHVGYSWTRCNREIGYKYPLLPLPGFLVQAALHSFSSKIILRLCSLKASRAQQSLTVRRPVFQ